MLETKEMAKGYRLVPDATGVGRPVVDMIRAYGVKRMVPVVITGGNAQTYDQESAMYHVPKRNLVSTLQILLGEERLKFAAGIPEAKIVKEELQNFKMKLTPKAKKSMITA